MASPTSLPVRNTRPHPAQADYRSTIPCQFHLQRRCTKGTSCAYMHAGIKSSFAGNVGLTETTETPPPVGARKDTRSTVPCRFFSSGSCVKGEQCPFAHTQQEETKTGRDRRGPALDLDKNDGADDSSVGPDDTTESWTRELSGAVVAFADGGVVSKVSFASDFSAVRLGRLPADATVPSVVALLATHGPWDVPEDGIRVLPPSADASGNPGHCLADVRVEDPLFATQLCAIPAMKAFLPVPVASVALPHAASSNGGGGGGGVRRVDSKKVHLSWHKATKTVWLNFGSGDIASKVSQRFLDGRYTICGQRVQASQPQQSPQSAGARSFSRNSNNDKAWTVMLRNSNNDKAWTVMLSNVPAAADRAHITQQIVPAALRPRHVEVGLAGGRSADAAMVCAAVKSLLLQAGPLEWWEESTGALVAGKRHHAKARFLHEADAARAVETLHGQPLPLNPLDKLTVQLVHSARIKVAARVFDAAAGDIHRHIADWKAQHVWYNAYEPANGFRVLKVESTERKDVAQAKGALEEALAGERALDDDGHTPLWSPAWAAGARGAAMRRLLTRVQQETGAVVLCDARQSQLRLVGTARSRQRARTALVDVLRAAPQAAAGTAAADKTGALPLDAAQLAWAFRGGYRAMVAALGADNVRLDIVSTPKRILVLGGGADAYQTALGLLQRRGTAVADEDETAAPAERAGAAGGAPGARVCSVCWTEAESPVQTPCQHVYCSGCLEDLCHAGAPAADGIRCVGAAATCGVALPRATLQTHLSSAALEDVLEASFAAHVDRHADALRHCPTADCGQIYHAAAAPSAATTLFTCPGCLAPVCRACHVVHEGMSCAEHRDRASGGYEALRKAKQKLGIKDCPRCGAPIEKIDGCNHMTCRCGAHICWVCLKTFSKAGLVYAHMSEAHGGSIDLPF